MLAMPDHPASEVAVALSAELAEKVEALYREHPAREFGDTPVFDRITVEPTTGEAGEETFQATIV